METGDRKGKIVNCTLCLFFLISTFPSGQSWSSEDLDHPKYGPMGSPIAMPLSLSHEYFQNPENKAPDFWKLIPYYVSQFNGGACSVATVAMIVNGFLRAGHGYDLKDQDINIAQLDLVLNKRQHQWKGKMTGNGFRGRLGLSLESLNLALKESLITFGMPHVMTEMTQVERNKPEDLAEFRRILKENEESSSDFLVVHFLQDILTEAAGGPFPHISPIGAYDIKNRKVLILDVDRKWYEPYWVPDHLLFDAMAAKTKTFGYGGYIRIWKP